MIHAAPEIADHEADLAIVRRVSGAFVGCLNLSELAAFNRLCEAGLAYRQAVGAGLIGLSRVAVQGDLLQEAEAR